MAAGIRKTGGDNDDAPRSKPHVERHARRLRKFQEILAGKRLDNMEVSELSGAAYNRARQLLDDDVFDDDDRERDDDDDDNGDIGTEKHKKESPPMDTVLSFMKASGIAGVCAAIVAKGATTISQDDLVSALGKVARERWPELSEAQAFSKVYSDPGAEGRVVRDAINVAKASLAETMLGPGLPVQVVGGPAAQDVNTAADAEAARAELMRVGRKQWPRLTENEVFERAFTDPRNAAIVARLYQRPLPTSIYPMPREWLRDEGSQHAKADRGSAYDNLMVKAEEYRNTHPELSIAQCFEKIYTDRANIELAKRERVESAPR